MPVAPEPARNLTGGLWLLADMSLNIWALSIVKALGLGYPAFQLVFLRALVGLALMLPWIWRQRAAFRDLPDLPLHLARVALSTVALTASFFAVARLPFALFTAIGFTRPLLMMVMAALLLHEVIPPRRWIAAVLGLCGVIVAVNPSELSGGWGLGAMFLTVFAGTSAIIATRRLAAAPTVVLMAFYTAGLTAMSAPFAAMTWQPVQSDQWPTLLAIGVFAQSAQFCFLQAHRSAQAAVLALLSYASLILSTAVGYLVFDEIPTPSFLAGATMIVLATLWITARRGRGLS